MKNFNSSLPCPVVARLLVFTMIVAIGFQSYCLAGERMGIRLFKMPQRSLFLLRVTIFLEQTLLDCCKPLVNFQGSEKKKIDTEHVYFMEGRIPFMEGRIFRGPYSTIFTDTTQNYKIEPNRMLKMNF